MACRGIDVSSYNGTIDWRRVREAGVEFTIIKIIDRDLRPDAKFETYFRDALEAGVEVQGVYNFSYAANISEARAAADSVVRVLGRNKRMVWLDIETDIQRRLSDGELFRIAKESERVYKRSGIAMGIYTNLSFYDEKFRPLADRYRDFPFWIAAYPTSARMDVRERPDERDRPRIANELYGWQYSDHGDVPGVEKTATDLNLWYAHIDGHAYDCDRRCGEEVQEE